MHDGTISALVLRANRDFPPSKFFLILSRSFSFHSHSLSSPKFFARGGFMKDPFWQDQPGSTPPSNWFKEHPKATMLILFGVIIVIVVISI